MTAWHNNDSLVVHYGPRLKNTKVCDESDTCDEDQPNPVSDNILSTYNTTWNTGEVTRGFGPLTPEE